MIDGGGGSGGGDGDGDVFISFAFFIVRIEGILKSLSSSDISSSVSNSSML